MSYKLLSSTSLKIIAITTMLIDHIGYIFYPAIITNESIYLILRLVGRISFPLFAFILVEGYFHTRSRNKYLVRLLIFALLTEVIFDFAFYQTVINWQHQNVLFTFLIGLFSLSVYELFKLKLPVLSLISVFILAITAEILNLDYGILGVLLIFLVYLLRGNFPAVAASIILANILFTDLSFNNLEGMLQAFAGLSVIFIYAYNGNRGFNLKYFFYLFYPLHLLVLYLLFIFMS